MSPRPTGIISLKLLSFSCFHDSTVNTLTASCKMKLSALSPHRLIQHKLTQKQHVIKQRHIREAPATTISEQLYRHRYILSTYLHYTETFEFHHLVICASHPTHWLSASGLTRCAAHESAALPHRRGSTALASIFI